MSNYKKISIKEWALEDRPREKLQKNGIAALSNSELIAILIGSGTREISAVELSKQVLMTCNNNLDELGKFSINDLTKVKGIGPAKAISIIAALELGKRRKSEEVLQRNKITASKDVAEIFSAEVSDLNYEEFWVLFLNRSNRVLEKVKLSQGGIAGTVMDVRLLLKMAIEKVASSIIICHNHPSGNKYPSESDKAITKKVKEAVLMVDIQLLDHIIIAGREYYSFADEGIL